MSKEMEIEFKSLLTEEEYLQLLQFYKLPQDELKMQTNIYFDTPNGLLRQLKQGLRIRLLPNTIEFTLKVPQHNNYTYLEITDNLVTFDHTQPLLEQLNQSTSEVLNYLVKENIPIESLKETGRLSTIRGESHLNPDTLLVLDKSSYYGVVDFEIEMEVTNGEEGRQFFHDFLDQHQLDYRPAPKKIARMFERKNSLTS